MSQESIVSTKRLGGHLRRAHGRIEKAVKGGSAQDVLIQAALTAFCVSTALRLLQLPPVAKAVSSVAPLLVFAAVFQRSTRGRRAAR